MSTPPSRPRPRAAASAEPTASSRFPSALLLGAALLLATLLSACGDARAAADGRALAAEPDPSTEPGVPVVAEKLRTVFRPLPAGPEAVAGVMRVLVPARGVSEGASGAPRLHVEIEGLSPGPHAWGVYRGTCDEADAEVGVALSALPGHSGLGEALTVDRDGRVVAEQAVPPLRRLFEETATFSVRVHQGAGLEAGPAVACATL